MIHCLLFIVCRYLILFTAGGHSGEKVRMLTGIHLLTVQSMLMFALAVCYDAQFPSDDGRCGMITVEKTCLSLKSPFDKELAQCAWEVSEYSDSGFECVYVPAKLTVGMVLIISVVVALCTAPINFCVDFLFIGNATFASSSPS
jgi:hypothetical protein